MSSFAPAEYPKIALLQAMKQGVIYVEDLWEKGVGNHSIQEKAAGKMLMFLEKQTMVDTFNL